MFVICKDYNEVLLVSIILIIIYLIKVNKKIIKKISNLFEPKTFKIQIIEKNKTKKLIVEGVYEFKDLLGIQYLCVDIVEILNELNLENTKIIKLENKIKNCDKNMINEFIYSLAKVYNI